MAGFIKSLKVTWDWTGDIYALKVFNVAITPEGSNPNEVTTAISRAGKDAFEHTFKDLVLEEGNYTAWVQAIYENIDSDWESAGGITVEDDGLQLLLPMTSIKLYWMKQPLTGLWSSQ